MMTEICFKIIGWGKCVGRKQAGRVGNEGSLYCSFSFCEYWKILITKVWALSTSLLDVVFTVDHCGHSWPPPQLLSWSPDKTPAVENPPPALWVVLLPLLKYTAQGGSWHIAVLLKVSLASRYSQDKPRPLFDVFQPQLPPRTSPQVPAMWVALCPLNSSNPLPPQGLCTCSSSAGWLWTRSVYGSFPPCIPNTDMHLLHSRYSLNVWHCLIPTPNFFF